MLDTTSKLLQTQPEQLPEPTPLQASIVGRILVAILVLLLSACATSETNSTDPISWQGANIGGAPGNHVPTHDGFTITSSGYDIWFQSDIFHFVHTVLEGDGEITARVSSLLATHEWAKAGLMIRASLDPDAINAAALLTAEHGVRLQQRNQASGPTVAIEGGAGEVGVWLRLARSGDTFTASKSNDGVLWSEIGSVQMMMPNSAYVGLALSSPALATEADFSSLSLTDEVSDPGDPPPPPEPPPPPPPPEPPPVLEFEHHFIASDIPGTPKWGYGMPALGDFDGDGDLDFVVGSRSARMAYWYEYRSAADWVRHDVGDYPYSTLGGIAHDVDGDGCVDIVGAGIWFENPCSPHTSPFTRHVYHPGITNGHDIAVADINNDGKLDVVEMIEQHFSWYSIPADPTETWPRTTVGTGVHGGFSPGGIGDLDGDGDNDIVRVNEWYENQDDGATWVAHDLPWGGSGPWGLSARSVVADLDRDGDQDIVLAASDQTDADQTEYKIGWLENGGDGASWTRHDLPMTQHVAPLGSFHSLQVEDFDGDGDLDVFSVEQEDMLDRLSDPAAQSKDIVWVVWENLTGDASSWQEVVILRAKLGGHDVVSGDVDGDGDIDLVSKVWRTIGYQGDNDGNPHVDFLENRLITTGGAGSPPEGFVPLFDGTLSGWHVTGAQWTVEGGVIVGEQDTPGSGGFLVTDASYENFELLLEIDPDYGTDSGVIMRAAEPVIGYQVTNDYRDGGDVGGIYGEGIGGWLQQAPNYAEFWNEGAWNRLTIRITGNPPRITSWLNDNQLADFQDTQLRMEDSGRIALQVHAGTANWEYGLKTRYRNLYIRELP